MPVFDEVTRATVADLIGWMQASQNYMGPPPPVTLYGKRPAEPITQSFEGFAYGMLYADGPVAAVEAYRLRVFGQAPLLFQEYEDGRPGKFFDDDALTRLRSPWPGGTLADLAKRALMFGDLGGNAFVLDVEDELVLVRPDWVDIVLEKRMWRGQQVGWRQVGILYYEGGYRTVEGAPFLPGEYAHFVPGDPDPLASYRGVSWLTPLVKEVQADKAATSHKLAFLENAASPNLAVTMPKEMNPEQFGQFVDKMNSQHAGPRQAGKTLYVGAGADVTLIGANMQQADFAGVVGKGENRIANMGGVPAVLIGFSEGLQGSSLNTGNYTAAKRNFVDTTCRDLWQNWAGSLQQMDAFKPPKDKARLWYDPRDIPFLHEDAKDKADIQGAQLSAINTGVTAGYEPDSVVQAIIHDDLSLLVGNHTGLTSAQLRPPAQAEGGQGSGVDGEIGGHDPLAALGIGDVSGSATQTQVQTRAFVDALNDVIFRAVCGDEDLYEDEIERGAGHDVSHEARVGGGHGRESGRFATHLIPAIEKWLKEGGDAPQATPAVWRNAAKAHGLTFPPHTSLPVIQSALAEKIRGDIHGGRSFSRDQTIREALQSRTPAQLKALAARHGIDTEGVPNSKPKLIEHIISAVNEHDQRTGRLGTPQASLLYSAGQPEPAKAAKKATPRVPSTAPTRRPTGSSSMHGVMRENALNARMRAWKRGDQIGTPDDPFAGMEPPVSVRELRKIADDEGIEVPSSRSTKKALTGTLVAGLREKGHGPAAPNAADVARRLDSADTREEAHALIASMGRDELHAVARELNMPASNSMTPQQLRTSLVEFTVGNRLDSKAIRDGATLPYDGPMPGPATQARPDLVPRLEPIGAGYKGRPPAGRKFTPHQREAELAKLDALIAEGQHAPGFDEEIGAKGSGTPRQILQNLRARVADGTDNTPRDIDDALFGLSIRYPDPNSPVGRLVHGFMDQRSAAPSSPRVPGGGARDAEVESRIRAAYRSHRSGSQAGGWMGLADLREAVGPDVSREEFDRVLRRMAIEGPAAGEPGSVRVIPVANTKALRPRDHAAALDIGGEANHTVAIDERSPSAPRVPAKKAAPGGPRTDEPADTVKATLASRHGEAESRIVADGKGGYKLQQRGQGDDRWVDMGVTGSSVQSITSRSPSAAWRRVPAKKAAKAVPDVAAAREARRAAEVKSLAPKDRPAALAQHSARHMASALAELEQLHHDGASTTPSPGREKSAMQTRMEAAANREHLPPAVEERLVKAGQSGDRATVHSTVDRLAAEHGLTRTTGRAGEVEPFDPAKHESLGAQPAKGSPVRVVSPGYDATHGGERFQARKAKVQAAANDGPIPGRPQSLTSGKLTPAQRSAVTRYTNSDITTHDVNSSMRAGKPDAALTRQVREAMAASTTTHDVTTYRGLHDQQHVWDGKRWTQQSGGVQRALGLDPSKPLPDNLTGHEFTERSFSSTTLRRGIAEVFSSRGDSPAGRVILEIHVPKGTHAVERPGGENELLLDSGLTYRVTGDRMQTDMVGIAGDEPYQKRVLTVEVVPSSDRPGETVNTAHESLIRDVYSSLAKRDDADVPLDKLRQALAARGLSDKAEQDAVLRRMMLADAHNIHSGVRFNSEERGALITPEMKQAALRVGGQDFHYITIRGAGGGDRGPQAIIDALRGLDEDHIRLELESQHLTEEALRRIIHALGLNAPTLKPNGLISYIARQLGGAKRSVDDESELDELVRADLSDDDLVELDALEEPDEDAIRAMAAEYDEIIRTAGADVTPGHDKLHHYWVAGRGLAKWVASKRPWTTLVAHLAKYVGLRRAKIFASRWFIEVFHFAAGSDMNRVTHGQKPRGKLIGPG